MNAVSETMPVGNNGYTGPQRRKNLTDTKNNPRSACPNSTSASHKAHGMLNNAAADKAPSQTRDSKKCARLAVVVMYLLTVSLTSIFLAIYYILFWDAKEVYARFNTNHTAAADVTSNLSAGFNTTLAATVPTTSSMYSTTTTP